VRIDTWARCMVFTPRLRLPLFDTLSKRGCTRFTLPKPLLLPTFHPRSVLRRRIRTLTSLSRFVIAYAPLDTPRSVLPLPAQKVSAACHGPRVKPSIMHLILQSHPHTCLITGHASHLLSVAMVCLSLRYTASIYSGAWRLAHPL
jgi:hypothetical protein